jgi:hypothetical protein
VRPRDQIRTNQSRRRRSSMTTRLQELAKSHGYVLVHGDDADFIAYQRHLGDGVWQTVSTWMIPHTQNS